MLSALDEFFARHAGLHCDQADASLIAVTASSGVAAIATIDQRDFSVCRINGCGRFTILLP